MLVRYNDGQIVAIPRDAIDPNATYVQFMYVPQPQPFNIATSSLMQFSMQQAHNDMPINPVLETIIEETPEQLTEPSVVNNDEIEDHTYVGHKMFGSKPKKVVCRSEGKISKILHQLCMTKTLMTA